MRKFFLLLSVCLLQFSLTHAEDKKEPDATPISLADIDGEPSSFVNQAVNAITGIYCDSQVDLVIPGPQPLTFARAYTSSDKYEGTLYMAWNLNHFGKVKINTVEEKEDYFYATQNDCFGAKRIYRGKRRSISTKLCKMKIPSKVLRNGATNCGSGEMSGRTNLRNFKADYLRRDGTVWITDGAGDIKTYLRSARGYSKQLSDWNHANGLRTHYTRQNYFGKSITLFNKDDTILSEFQIEYPGERLFMKNPVVTVTANDGREITYKFCNWKVSRIYTKYAYFLTEVLRPNAPNEKYFYKEGGHRIIRKERPDNRFMLIDYYHTGSNKVGGKTIKIRDDEDPRYKRVKRLRAPVGRDEQAIITHLFKYKIRKCFKGGIKGCTTVYDVYNNVTKYHFGKQSRLRKIERFDSDTKLYSSERLFWAPDRTADATNLVSRGFYDENDQVIFCRHYEYDKHGNVLSDNFYGNFSGESQDAPTVKSNGTVEGAGSEVYVRNYTYNDQHRVTSEREGNHKITYTYEGNFVTSKLLWDEDTIIFREFYTYDKNGVLTEKVCDDGSDATERHIQRITTTKSFPYGLPEAVETLAVDMQTGLEVLINKEVNRFSKEGWVLQKDHYDCNDSFYASEYWNYDGMGNVTLAIDKLGQVTEKEYDANGNLIFDQSPCLDFHTLMTYDFSNRLIREEQVHTNGNHFIITHKYDYLGNRIATIDTYGNETEFTYDVFGRMIASKSPLVLDGEGNPYRPITQTEYDHLGNPTRQVDSRGNEKNISYNVRGKPVFVEHPDGSFEKNIYNIDGTLKQSISRNGTYTLYTYDIKKRVIEEEVFSELEIPLTSAIKSYDAFHLISETDANGIKKTYTYDFAGRMIEACKAESRVNFAYDSQGRISEERSAEGAVKRFEYDALDRVIAECDGVEDRITRTTYDEMGNKKEIITGDTITTTLYNSYGQLVEAIDALGNSTITHFDYGYINDLGQNVAYCEVIDSLGNVTVKISDALGREAEVLRKNPLGEVKQKRNSFFDGADNCVRVVETVITPDAADREVITRWEYDHEDRQTAVIEAYGTPEEKTTAITYNYVGEKECIVKPDGVEIHHTYDPLGRLERLTASDGSIDYGYTYDKNSNPLTLTDHRTGSVTSRVYDRHNRLVSETMGNGLTLRFTYDATGRPTKVILPDQSSIEYAYEGIDLASVTRVKDEEEKYQHRYTRFDASGNLLEAESPIGKLEFCHDLNGRIKSIHSPFWNLNEIEYDSEGNLTSQVIIDSVGETKNGFIYDDLYQIKQEKGAFTHSYDHDSVYNRVQKDDHGHLLNSLNQLLDDGINTYAYDRNGCLVKKSESEYIYDALNRLTEVNRNGVKVTYTYDSENRRLSKTVGRKTIRYLYHGKNEIGACDAKGKIIELRLLGTGKGAEIGAAIALEFNDVPYFPIHDQNGNVACIVDKQGHVVETYRYSAFGEEQIFGTDESINPWRFASKRFDEETGTLFFGRRHYDPTTGRWITPDPMGLSAGPNLYAYVNNSPLTNVDLYGLFLQSLLGFVGGALELIGDHLVPVPGLGIGIGFAGYVLGNRTHRGFQHSSQYKHSKNYGTGTFEAGPLVRTVYVNGMMTRKDKALATAVKICAAIGGWKIHTCHNATHGFMSDLLECVAQFVGIPTNSERKLTILLREQIASMGGVAGGGKVNVIAHSQGGLILHRAMKNLRPEELKMLDVITLGSAKMISSKGLSNATNFISAWDGVPRLDFIGLMIGLLDKNTNISHIASITYPCGDHGIDHENYWGVIENFGRAFRKEYGDAPCAMY